MSRIVTNVQSLVAQRVLGAQNKALNQSLTRLSTGLRINSGADDPAGLIASESLRSQKVAVNAAIDNANRADNVLSVAEGALQEVNRLLLDLADLVDRSASTAGLSEAELAANQSQIDAILQSIDRIANTAEFNGTKLLGGGFGFTTSGVVGADISDVQVNAAKIPEGATRSVAVEVVTGSTFASVSAVGGGGSGTLSAATSIEVRGALGSEIFSFASGTTQAAIVTAINSSTQLTGVSASTVAVSGTDHVRFSSTAFGSDAIVSVQVVGSTGRIAINGSDTTNDHSSSSNGTDGTVIINGTQANVNGLKASIRTGSLAVDLTLASAFGGSTTAVSSSFDITGGGARFNIAPDVSLVGMETIGIQSVSTASLGNNTDGFLSTLASGGANDIESSNFAAAQRVVEAAQEQISDLRGRIGGFQRNTLQTAVNSLLIALENTSAAESAIRETDFAETTSALTRAQILVSSSTTTLQLANAQPQAVLSLLQ
ncbi:MAG: flagellin [Phycisphaerales bacterium]|nr:flagellin [Phycisphaerales bacterium]